jgi:hypothetical protein
MRGVYLEGTGTPTSGSAELFHRARAALAVCPDGSLISGVTALAIEKVTIPDGVDPTGPINVAIPWGARRYPDRPEIAAHLERVMPARWSPSHPVAEPAHCWARAAAAHVGVEPWIPGHETTVTVRGSFTDPAKQAFLQVIQLGDALMRRDHAVLAYSDFADRIAGWGPRRGAPLVRELFQHVKAGTDSPAETWLRLVVVDAGFPEPAVNHRVRAEGHDRYLDLSWPDLGIALEYHGRHHFHDPSQSYSDVYRRGGLQELGWVVLEATHEDLLEPARMLARLATAFRRAPR